MPVEPRIQQHPLDIVSLQGWELDSEFPFGPQGAKPKRIFICPNPPPHCFLIGGHRYLFKEPAGPWEQQIWSEVIAYELSRDLDVVVPPAFLAVAPGNGSPGVLVEFFHGYAVDPEPRFVHAIDLLQGSGRKVDFEKGSLRDNIDICRIYKAPSWRRWWAGTLALDSIIGNTDRHTQNWGFMTRMADAGLDYWLAPAFDNGTSLGFIVRDADLAKFSSDAAVQRFVGRGSHHFGWTAGDRPSSQHARLCRLFRDRFGRSGDAMDGALELADARITSIVDWCGAFPFPLAFTEERARFVAAQLRVRRNGLAAALGA